MIKRFEELVDRLGGVGQELSKNERLEVARYARNMIDYFKNPSRCGDICRGTLRDCHECQAAGKNINFSPKWDGE